MVHSQEYAYLLRRVTHRNLAAVLGAMEAASVTSITGFAVAAGGTGDLLNDMDHTFSADFIEGVSVPPIELEAIIDDGENGLTIVREAKNFRAAVRETMRNILETTAPGWNGAQSAMGSIALTVRYPEFRGSAIDLTIGPHDDCDRIMQRFLPDDPLAAFGYDARSDPMRIIPEGWHRISSTDQAKAAGVLHATNIAEYYKVIEAGGESGFCFAPKNSRPGVAEWFAFLRHDGGKPVVDAVLAAQREEDYDADVWPGNSYVLGAHGADVYAEMSGKIEALAIEKGLYVRPNYAGSALQAPPEDSIETPGF